MPTGARATGYYGKSSTTLHVSWPIPQNTLASHIPFGLHTHLMDCWESTPRIAFVSPERGSGKTRALEITEALTPNPVHAVNVSPAYLFRKVGDEDGGRPTILYDEVDTLFGSKVQDTIGYDREQRHFTRGANRAGGLEGGMTNGQDVLVRGMLKPISTLRRPLESVDLATRESALAAYERSDVAVVPAAGVIGEAMVALVLAGAMIEKFGGDSLGEAKRNYQGYLEQVKNF